MSQRGILLRRLLECTKPFCATCQYGKLTRKPWQSKGGPTNPIRRAPSSGQIVSINQLESSTAGFIAQLKGKLTTQRYQYMTVFVDQHSRYAYVYLQWTITSPETIQAKHSFERMAEDIWVSGFITIMPTMVDSWIKASSKIVRSNVKGSPTVESMPTSKMALRRRRSVTSRNRHGQ